MADIQGWRTTLLKPEFSSRRVPLPVSAEEAFAWRERPGALERLIPPWEDVRIVSRGEGINEKGLISNVLYLVESDYSDAAKTGNPSPEQVL